MKKPGIGDIPPGDPTLRTVLQALKTNVEIITGRREARIADLPPNPSTTDIARKINEILARLQD